jgi:hypothetical protein
MIAIEPTGAAPPRRERAGRDTHLRSRARAGIAVFGAGLAGLVAWAAWCGRGIWFFIDEWVVITRYTAGEWLTPFNGHLSLVPIAAYRFFLSTGGYDAAPNRAFALLCYASAAVAVFVFARTRVDPLFAALAGLLVAWSSQAQLLIMFPLLFNFTLPAAALVFIWLLMERDRVRSDIGASLLLALALATSSVGLLAAFTVLVDLGLQRERRLRRWATFAPPIVLWSVWYVRYDRGRTGAGGTVRSVVSFAWHEFLATFVALGAESKIVGVAVFVAVVAVVGASITRWHTFDRRAAVIALSLFGFLLLTAIGRNAAGEKFHVAPVAPATDRFVWINGLIIICLVVHCLRSRGIPAVAFVAIAALVVGNAVLLAGRLSDYRTSTLANNRNIRTLLAAVDALGPRANPHRLLPLGFIPVPTADYQRLVRHYGSPTAGTSVDDLGDEATRRIADSWLVSDLDVRVLPGVGEACTAAPDPNARDGIQVRAPSTVEIRTGDDAASVFVRRLARRFSGPALASVPPHSTAVLQLDRDGSTLPWFVRAPHAVQIARCAPSR